jgi:hypothetical protein
VWLEGDAEDRDKSLDSNWFGPISRNLVIGRVACVLWPWKHFAQVKWQDAELPDRLEVDAVYVQNPDDPGATDVFRNGYAQGILARMQDPATGTAEHAYHTGRPVLLHLLKTSHDEVEKHDPETEALAAALYKEVKAALEHKGKMPVPLFSEDLARAAVADRANTEAAVRALYQQAVAAAGETNKPSRRTYNNTPPAPCIKGDTPRPVLS